MFASRINKPSCDSPAGWASSGRTPRCSSGRTPCCRPAGWELPWSSELSSETEGGRAAVKPAFSRIDWINENINKMAPHPDVIRRHRLQVVLKGLTPLDGRLELVHFDQVVCRRNTWRKLFTGDSTRSSLLLQREAPPLTQQRQQHGVIIGHHEQVDAVQSRAGLQVAEGLAQVTVPGTVTHKHLKQRVRRSRRSPLHSPSWPPGATPLVV